MQHFSQKESPVLFCFFLWQQKNNKSSTSFRANVPKMCRRSSGITADLHLSVGYSVSPLLLVQLFYFYTLQQQNQTEALWSAASRRCSSACVNWSQSLHASVRRLQLVGRLAAMTAAAADDSLSECINNAKSYLHSAKKLKMGLFFSVTVTSQTDVQLLAAQTSSENDPQWKIWFSELRGVCLCVFVVCFFSASSTNKNQSWTSASNPPKVIRSKVLRLLLSTNPQSDRANVNYTTYFSFNHTSQWYTNKCLK